MTWLAKFMKGLFGAKRRREVHQREVQALQKQWDTGIRRRQACHRADLNASETIIQMAHGRTQ